MQSRSVLLHDYTGHFDKNRLLLEKYTWQHKFLSVHFQHVYVDHVADVHDNNSRGRVPGPRTSIDHHRLVLRASDLKCWYIPAFPQPHRPGGR